MAKHVMSVMTALLMGLALAACGDDDGGGGEDVTATLTEFTVTPEPASVDAGSVTIKADNVGGDTHELVLVRADSPADLPTDDDGAVDEEGFASAGVEAIGEVEEVEPGTSKDLTADLEAGTYVIFCNVVETESDGAVESHFAEGMVATLTVS